MTENTSQMPLNTRIQMNYGAFTRWKTVCADENKQTAATQDAVNKPHECNIK